MPVSRSPSIIVRRVAPELVRPLRAAILRPGRPAIESVYPYDDHAEAGHFAAIDANDQVVGSASVFHEAAAGEHVPNIAGERDPWRGGNAWRLRGMTVIEPLRGTGCGAKLLLAAIDHIVSAGGTCLWFHARAGARGFYERFRFATVGGVYEVPHIGEHVFMWRLIDLADAAQPGARHA